MGRYRWTEELHPRDAIGRFGLGGPANELSHNQNMSLKEYRGGPGARVNDLLRGDKEIDPFTNIIVTDLDRAMYSQEGGFVGSAPVYRHAPMFTFDDGLAPGDQLVDQGFMSTSTDPYANEWAGDDRLEITVPEGTPVFDFNQYDPNHRFAYQKEILLPRGAVLRIDEIGDYYHQEEGEIYRNIKATVVGFV